MHIAFWSPAWPLHKYPNGVITYVHAMRLALQRLGHRVSIFTATADQTREDEGVFVIPSAYPGIWKRATRRLLQHRHYKDQSVFATSTAIAAEILRVHRRDHIDIIEMEESFGWFAEVARLTALPLVVKLHGPAFLSLVDNELNTPFAREKIYREGKALGLAQTIVSPCKSTLLQTIGHYKLSPRVVEVIVNPLSLEEDIPLWRVEACDRNNILFVGRFDLRKGADIMLKAFLSLLIEQPKLKLTFAGPDAGIPDARGNLLEFNAYCDTLFSKEQRAQCDFRGRMSNQDIAALRPQAMATVIASRWENQGYTLLEAMSQGCPIVSTDAGGCPESVVDGVTGRLAKSEQPQDFAEKLRQLIQDPRRAAIMGQAARARVLEHHAPATVAGLAVKIYERTIAMHVV